MQYMRVMMDALRSYTHWLGGVTLWTTLGAAWIALPSISMRTMDILRCSSRAPIRHGQPQRLQRR